eukprot:GEMP01045548.1.p1 GENE.GEMP01045548.1~~GEMP01045548.1.p1  ORF type:complete len:145 (+),score=25.83 GEMP01045548.1:118-552(+)
MKMLFGSPKLSGDLNHAYEHAAEAQKIANEQHITRASELLNDVTPKLKLQARTCFPCVWLGHTVPFRTCGFLFSDIPLHENRVKLNLATQACYEYSGPRADECVDEAQTAARQLLPHDVVSKEDLMVLNWERKTTTKSPSAMFY